LFRVDKRGAAAGLALVSALTLSPPRAVAALRQTGVVFATDIGHFLLGEALTRRRIATCMAVAIGAACLGFSR